MLMPSHGQHSDLPPYHNEIRVDCGIVLMPSHGQHSDLHLISILYITERSVNALSRAALRST